MSTAVPQPKPTSPASEAWLLMDRLHQMGRGAFFAACTEVELSPPQVLALRLLDPGTPTAMSDLAGLMHCDNSNITGIVDRLESRGLVQRRAATHDRRIKHLFVTDAGVAVRGQLDELLGTPPEPLLALTAAEQRQLAALLRKALGER